MNVVELREYLTTLVENYPHPQAAVVPALHFLRDHGAPPGDEALSVVADVCAVEPRQVAEIVGHYSVFQQPAAMQTSVCMGLICYLHGAQEILDQLQSEPGCDEAGKHVKVSACLGYCHAAPVLALADGAICKITDSKLR